MFYGFSNISEIANAMYYNMLRKYLVFETTIIIKKLLPLGSWVRPGSSSSYDHALPLTELRKKGIRISGSGL